MATPVLRRMLGKVGVILGVDPEEQSGEHRQKGERASASLYRTQHTAVAQYAFVE